MFGREAVLNFKSAVGEINLLTNGETIFNSDNLIE